MARLPVVTSPANTGFSSIRVGPLRQSPPSDTSHQKLVGTMLHVIALNTVSLTISAIAASTAVEQVFAPLPGNLVNVALGDVVFVTCQSGLPAGVSIGNARITAAGTMALQVENNTGGSITPGALNFNLLVLRP